MIGANAKADELRLAHWASRWLIVIAAVLQLARILHVESSTGEVPFLSANDRSRWCTIAALAINGRYEIDDILQIRDPDTRRRTWYTIDLVRHRGADREQHYYSSKPPLLPTLYAGAYMGLRAVTGATLMNDPFFVARCMLIVCNLLPLVLCWWLVVEWLARRVTDPWSLVTLTTFMVLGTFLSTFTITLNNHLPAALAVALSIFCIDRILIIGDHRWRWFGLCGLATSFAAANELPALSWVAAAGALLLIASWRGALLGYLPSLLPVAIAFFATNYAAHGELAPAYVHRGLGERITQVTVPEKQAIEQLEIERLESELTSTGIELQGESFIRPARREGVWELWNPATEQRFGLARDETSEGMVNIHDWGDWYDYPESYWTSDRKRGVDRGEPSRTVYIFHCLIGHHGVFSLTPFWLLSLIGYGIVFASKQTWNLFREHRWLIATAIAATSIVVIGFYLARPLEDRNYGGVTSGFRWSFWLIPLWGWLGIYGLQLASPAIDADSTSSSIADCERRGPRSWVRRLVELSVLSSIFSATYPWENPWTSPWLMQYWQYLGWVSQ